MQKEKGHQQKLMSYGASDGTWTRTRCHTRPSNVPVCLFQHTRVFFQVLRYYNTYHTVCQPYFWKKLRKFCRNSQTPHCYWVLGKNCFVTILYSYDMFKNLCRKKLRKVKKYFWNNFIFLLTSSVYCAKMKKIFYRRQQSYEQEYICSYILLLLLLF